MSGLRVSVVLATYRRPDLLQRCLQALAAQTLPGDAFEVIVVDDGHTDDTRAVVQAFQQRHGQTPAFRYLRSQGTRGPAGARNVGWRAAQSPLIAFTDDDTIPAPTWLQEACAGMQPTWSGAGGRLVVPRPARFTDHARNTLGLEQAEFATANAFAWREALLRVGGFDERYTRAWREDSDLQFELMRRCGPVGFIPGAVVEHPVREVPWGFSLQTQANVFFDALLFKKHPTLYRQRLRRRPPWRYHLIVACTLAAVVTALAGRADWAAWLCVPALLAFTLFAWQRLRGTSHAPADVAEMLLTSIAIPYVSMYWRLKGAWHFRVLFL
jgi:glycosyltransferase involved in cell wall biosynthesis